MLLLCVRAMGGAHTQWHNTTASHLAPNTPKLAPLFLGLGLVQVRHPLPEVPRCVLGAFHVLQLEQRRVGVLVRLGALVAEEEATNVESRCAVYS